ncbi:DUF262 domain-containing protein [Rhizobium phaseoli]|uniref:DUF262 domain-containing protein n=1 Tax=Rhizobium phaseoli TaxID=396 RepID=A0A7X6F943_9HYPH|nr:DUF262 domain-containing protein [Rhizobium phaseoli]NKF14402.1 DUF262 domain-containing protein [Rhizobium phaseoli]QPK09804.1 DUF262 domain-containing protein [Rhizobium phaseoli]
MITSGEIAIILRALQNHTALEHDYLKEIVEKQWDEERGYLAALSSCFEKGLVEKSGAFLKLSNEGISWIQENNAEFSVEKDLEHSGDGGAQPTKPYDVAKLKMETKPLSVFQALRKIERAEIDLSPEFQRAFVWDELKQSRLIESMIIKIPLPAFYIDATTAVRWIVVDGLQRLTTLYRYCRLQDFALSGLQFLTELNGKKFDELPPEYKVAIEDDTQLMFYNLMPGTPPLAKYTIFSRVNTGGMQLTPQEIRHALNQGPCTELLRRMAKSPEFLSATQGVVESLRMSDRELILRALAFTLNDYSSYREHGDMESFLVHAMNQINALSEMEIKNLEQEFYSNIGKVRKIFGIYSFRKYYMKGGRRSPLNKALFEVWTVTVKGFNSSLIEQKKDAIVTEFLSAMNTDDRFVRSISASTGTYSAVEKRFKATTNILEKAFNA